MNKRVIEIILVLLIGLIVGFFSGTQLDTIRHTQTQIDTFSISTESQMSAYEAEVFINGAINAHQYYIDRPELQNAGTGDTVFNERIIKQYNRLKKLIGAKDR